MKLKVLFTSMIFLATQSVFANLPPKPDKCPGIPAIQNVGIIDMEQDDTPGVWYAGVESNAYDTKEVWTFSVGPITATDENDAKNKAEASLASLTLREGPLPFTPTDSWACVYNNKSGYKTFSVTPTMGIKL